MDTTEAARLAQDLMSKHLPSDWNFCWSQHKSFLGRCTSQTKTIELSYPLTQVNSVDEMTDTILHEIAHALAGPDAKHGAVWKSYARALGATPRAASRNAESAEGRYRGDCPNGHVIYGYRTPTASKMSRSCIKCSRKFNPVYCFRWVDTVTGKVLRDFAADVRPTVTIEPAKPVRAAGCCTENFHHSRSAPCS